MLRCIPWKHRVSYVRPNTCCLVTDSLKGSVRGSGAQNPHTGYSTNPGRPEPWNEALFLETPIGLYISVSAFSYECVRNGNPLQYSFLENPMDRGAWRATVHGPQELDMTEWSCAPVCHTCVLVCACVSWWAKTVMRDYHTKWSKSDRERQIPFDMAYVWNLKKVLQMKLFIKQK